ncbi:MAG: hypothetical protein IJV99_01195 [Clostridia bacterium]|nr:hypothetical protein [Clostridia bacterium]
MKRLKKKLILICLTVLLVVSLMGFGISSVSANQAVLSEVTYQRTYKLGDEFQIQSAKFTYQSKEYDAEGVICYPSGKRVSKDSVLLTEAGKHSIEYLANADGKLLKKTVEFVVLDNVYSIDGVGEMSYGENEYFSEYDGINGLNVSLGKESTFKYNKVIDVSKLTRTDSVMEWYCTPQITGSYDVKTVYFRLTDVYDPENYVQMRYTYHTDSGYAASYVNVNANGQLPTGLHYRSKGPTATTLEFNGYDYTLYKNSRHYGYYAELSFNGQTPPYSQTGFIENCMRFAIDYKEKQVYCTPAWGGNLNKCIVTDLDDARIYPDDPWQGFTTGEVVLSVWAEQYSTSNYNFFVTKIHGAEVGDLFAENTIAPNISVDTLGYAEDDLPEAIVGREYKLFNATVLDEAEGVIPHDVVVYYNYNNSSRAQLSIKDGKFTPNRPGVYTLVYTGADSFGNSCRKIIEVNAIVKEELEYTLSSHQTTAKAGSVVNVAEIDILNEGKNFNVDIKAKLNGTDVVYDVDKETLSFRPLYIGIYNIEYCYSDYSFVESVSYELKVEGDTQDKLVIQPVLPRYLIKDCEYVFDKGTAYSFKNTTQTIPTELFVEGTGIAKTKLEDFKYTVTNDVDSINLIYVAGNAEEVYTLPVVDVGYGDKLNVNLSGYLQGKAFTASSDRYGTTFSTNAVKAKDGVATLSVINLSYLIRDFQLAFTGVDGKANFSTLKVLFTSFANANDVIEFRFDKQEDLTSKLTVTRNDFKVTSSSESSFKSGDDTGFSIIYDNGDFVVGGSDIRLSYQELFQGFGDYFYIDIELSGITGESAIYVKKVVNQTISSSKYDTVKPTIISKDFKASYVYGDTVFFDVVDCYDFVDPNATVKVLVSMNGEYVQATDGTILNGVNNKSDKTYQYEWNSYDDLLVEIVATDFSGQKATENPVLVMLDVVKPVITLGKAKTSCSVGDTVNIASYTVSDDRQLNVLTVVVIAPNGETQIVTSKSYVDENYKKVSKNKFKASKKGVYTVAYMVNDTAGNAEFVTYTVVCA